MQKSGTGLKRFIDSTGYGSWFMKLFQLVFSRDFCNPNEAIESGTSRGRDDYPTNDDDSFEKDSRSDISPDTPYVPRRKSKKK